MFQFCQQVAYLICTFLSFSFIFFELSERFDLILFIIKKKNKIFLESLSPGTTCTSGNTEGALFCSLQNFYWPEVQHYQVNQLVYNNIYNSEDKCLIPNKKHILCSQQNNSIYFAQCNKYC